MVHLRGLTEEYAFRRQLRPGRAGRQPFLRSLDVAAVDTLVEGAIIIKHCKPREFRLSRHEVRQTQHAIERARDNVQVVAAWVRVVGLQPAVRDAYDGQGGRCGGNGSLDVTQREEGLRRQLLPRREDTSLFGQFDHPMRVEQRYGSYPEHRLDLGSSSLFPERLAAILSTQLACKRQGHRRRL
eukprot:scaffold51397_cov23-Tisochrysis_lutea.AAC.3